MIILAVYGGVKAYMYYEAKDKVDGMLARLRLTGVEANYNRISTSIFGPVGVKGLVLRIPQVNEQISFGDVIVQSFDQKENQLPTHVRISSEDIKFNARLFDKLFAGYKKNELFEDSVNLEELGYSTITMDIDVALNFLAADNEFVISLTQHIEDMWDVRFFMDLTDLPITQAPSTLGFKIKELRIQYKDNTYIDRLFKHVAKKQGLDVAIFKKQLIDKFDADIAQKKIKWDSESIQSYRSFINNPKNITITMYPYQPVSVGSINHYDPSDIPMLLNLRVLNK